MTKKFICNMECLDTNQVHFRGQLPKIMKCSNYCDAVAHFGIICPGQAQRRSPICRSSEGSRHICKYRRCTQLYIWTKIRFSLEDSSGKGVSYFKTAFLTVPDAVSPSFQLHNLCKHTQKEKTHNIWNADRKSTIGKMQREFPFATRV